MTIIFRNRRLNATVRIALANAFYEPPEGNEDDWETWVGSRVADLRRDVVQICDGIEFDGLHIDKTPHTDDLLDYDDEIPSIYTVELHWYGHETPKLTGGVAFADRVAEQEEELVNALAAIEYVAGVEATTIVLPIAVEE